MNLTSLLSMFVNTLLNPFPVIFGLLLIGALLMALRRNAIGQRLIYAAAIYWLLILVPPVDMWLMQPLENRFPRGPLPERVDGILVLDGGMDSDVVTTRGTLALHLGALRLVAAADVSRRFPDARLIYAGGENSTAAAQILFGGMGVDPSRVIFDDRALNTWDNFVFSKDLVQPKEGETWVLVTSASHMPRAMGIAQHLNWKLIPWPSEYTMPNGAGFGSSWVRASEDRLRNLQRALHEWVALVVYRSSGRIDTLFPGPDESETAN